ncbi:hypothetical protein GCM10023205_79850 [Yinghuangia aomiensis]|uniref:SnoaL-like domain-containing protein n=1 Tax=Yinghuangia aomiensis TaxID=676205 RepID=A0ABP9IF67_9ACTN
MADQSLGAADRLDIIDTCRRMARCVDDRRWRELGELVAEEIELDYSDVSGRTPVRYTRAEYTKHSAALLANEPVTQHQVASHIVEGSGDRARCISQFQATHVLPGTNGDPVWALGGQYDMGLIKTDGRWQIRSIRATRRWTTGNWQVVVAGRTPVAATTGG